MGVFFDGAGDSFHRGIRPVLRYVRVGGMQRNMSFDPCTTDFNGCLSFFLLLYLSITFTEFFSLGEVTASTARGVHRILMNSQIPVK